MLLFVLNNTTGWYRKWNEQVTSIWKLNETDVRSQYLFWAVKVSLWGWRPLYTTRIRSCWQSAPSVSAMDPRLEGCSYRQQTVCEPVRASNAQCVNHQSSIHQQPKAGLFMQHSRTLNFYSTINIVWLWETGKIEQMKLKMERSTCSCWRPEDEAIHSPPLHAAYTNHLLLSPHVLNSGKHAGKSLWS